MTKRELLEACAKATGRKIIQYSESWDCEPDCVGLQLEDGSRWNPADDDGNCARMEAEKRVDVKWGINFVEAGVFWHQHHHVTMLELYADHASPQAARRWASCRAVAAMVGEKV